MARAAKNRAELDRLWDDAQEQLRRDARTVGQIGGSAILGGGVVGGSGGRSGGLPPGGMPSKEEDELNAVTASFISRPADFDEREPTVPPRCSRRQPTALTLYVRPVPESVAKKRIGLVIVLKCAPPPPPVSCSDASLTHPLSPGTGRTRSRARRTNAVPRSGAPPRSCSCRRTRAIGLRRPSAGCSSGHCHRWSI